MSPIAYWESYLPLTMLSSTPAAVPCEAVPVSWRRCARGTRSASASSVRSWCQNTAIAPRIAYHDADHRLSAVERTNSARRRETISNACRSRSGDRRSSFRGGIHRLRFVAQGPGPVVVGGTPLQPRCRAARPRRRCGSLGGGQSAVPDSRFRVKPWPSPAGGYSACARRLHQVCRGILAAGGNVAAPFTFR